MGQENSEHASLATGSIRPASSADAEAIAELYNHYVQETIVTFEEEAVSAGEMASRIEQGTAKLPWLVYQQQGSILGFSYASPWKGRCAYRFSVESTVYLAAGATGKGLGTILYRALLDELAASSFHSVLAGIALPNPASVALHERLGFCKAAHFTEVGRKFDRWIDVGYWQLLMSEYSKAP